MGIIAWCRTNDPPLADLLVDLVEHVQVMGVGGWHVRELVRNLIIVQDLQTTHQVERQGEVLVLRAA